MQHHPAKVAFMNAYDANGDWSEKLRASAYASAVAAQQKTTRNAKQSTRQTQKKTIIIRPPRSAAQATVPPALAVSHDAGASVPQQQQKRKSAGTTLEPSPRGTAAMRLGAAPGGGHSLGHTHRPVRGVKPAVSCCSSHKRKVEQAEEGAVHVSAWSCSCMALSERQLDLCVAEKHVGGEELIVVKRRFVCDTCQAEATTLNSRAPSLFCQTCKAYSFTQACLPLPFSNTVDVVNLSGEDLAVVNLLDDDDDRPATQPRSIQTSEAEKKRKRTDLLARAALRSTGWILHVTEQVNALGLRKANASPNGHCLINATDRAIMELKQPGSISLSEFYQTLNFAQVRMDIHGILTAHDLQPWLRVLTRDKRRAAVAQTLEENDPARRSKWLGAVHARALAVLRGYDIVVLNWFHEFRAPRGHRPAIVLFADPDWQSEHEDEWALFEDFEQLQAWITNVHATLSHLQTQPRRSEKGTVVIEYNGSNHYDASVG